jgi:glucokinase
MNSTTLPDPSADRRYHACVDIGGTKVAVSLADDQSPHNLQLYARQTEATQKHGDNGALAAQVVRLIHSACAARGIAPAQVASVGVSSCGPFVMKAGMVELAAPNICGGLAGTARGLPNDWQSALLEAPLAAQFPNVRVENDGIGALEAERRWGALQGQSHCAYVTWSTGVGVGLCVDGRVLRGKNRNAGHAGHLFVSDPRPGEAPALCGCGNTHDVEGLVAGNALARRYSAHGHADAASFFAAAKDGDAWALAEVDELCRVMGRTLYNLTVTLDLQRISLGGSVFWHHQALLLPRLQRHVQGHLSALTDGLELVPAGLGMQVGDYGALALMPAQ